MSRWTNVDEFKTFLSEVRARYNLFSDEERPHYEAYSKALYILNEYLEDAPSIDLVRCRECRWGKPYSDKQLECDALGLGGLKYPDDYCSYGERKESE